jgi:enoyl-CoA hydratase
MAVRIEKSGPVWTVIHSRPDARNAMDPASADALVAAFHSFDADPAADVAVLWGEGGAFCAGWDLKYAASLTSDKPLASLNSLSMAAPLRVGHSARLGLNYLSPSLQL